jgi:hypothetical protein
MAVMGARGSLSHGAQPHSSKVEGACKVGGGAGLDSARRAQTTRVTPHIQVKRFRLRLPEAFRLR